MLNNKKGAGYITYDIRYISKDGNKHECQVTTNICNDKQLQLKLNEKLKSITINGKTNENLINFGYKVTEYKPEKCTEWKKVGK